MTIGVSFLHNLFFHFSEVRLLLSGHSSYVGVGRLWLDYFLWQTLWQKSLRAAIDLLFSLARFDPIDDYRLLIDLLIGLEERAVSLAFPTFFVFRDLTALTSARCRFLLLLSVTLQILQI